MSIQTSAQQTPITAPNATSRIADKDGNWAVPARNAIQQTHDFVVNMARTHPVNASTNSNLISLTMLPVQPTVTQYSAYDTFSFVADANSTGLVTAKVVTKNGAMAILPVFKNNGSAQATSGDITAGLHYNATFVDSLNGGKGGFVLR